MANVSGPLFSIDAIGSIANTLCFKKGMRGTVCRKWAKPTGEPSQAQVDVREFTRIAMTHWPEISLDGQLSWVPLSLSRNIEPINCYLQENWRLYKEGKQGTDVWPIVEAPALAQIMVTRGEGYPEPDWTGTYTETGSLNGQPYYVRDIGEQVFLFFNGSNWEFGSELSAGPEDYFANADPDITFPFDAYGVYTGNLVCFPLD